MSTDQWKEISGLINENYFQRSLFDVLPWDNVRFIPVGVTRYFVFGEECVLQADLLICLALGLYRSKLSQLKSLGVRLGAWLADLLVGLLFGVLLPLAKKRKSSVSFIKLILFMNGKQETKKKKLTIYSTCRSRFTCSRICFCKATIWI